MSTVMHNPVFVVDDDPAARESVAALVRSHGMDVETFDSAESFLARNDCPTSGCLVVDMRMTGMGGINLQNHLRREGSDLPVIIITGYGDISTAVRAMRLGAVTFLEKPCDDRLLWEAICQALKQQAAARNERAQRAQIRGRLAMLTPDEHQVLQKLMAGNPNKTIAKELDLGLRTVELRRATVLHKMQATSLAELVRMVIASGEFPGSAQEAGRTVADDGAIDGAVDWAINPG